MFKQKDRLDDIFLAPTNIINARNKYKNNITVCYEDLVNNPPRELNKIFNYLALSSPDNLGEYNLEGSFTKKISIDRKSLGFHSKPKTDYIDSWKTSIETPKIKKLTIDYLNMLGSDSINQLGYSYNELMLSLKQHKPKKRKVALSLSLDLLPKGKSAHNFVSKTINRSKTMFIEILKKVKLW